MNTRIYYMLFALLTLQFAFAQPDYASMETKEVIEKMIQAHGGMEKWTDLESLTFTSTMHSDALGALRFWVKTETFDMKTRRSYQDWPVVGSQLSYDGKEVWTSNWRVGNPPNHQRSVYFYYANLPWLTQDSNVRLSEAELIEHKAFDNKVYKVVMSFTEAPTLGKSEKDTYTLFIDSETYLLNGYEYTVGYRPLLDIMNIPKDQEVFGPVFRQVNYTGEVGGLKFPMLMTTTNIEMTQRYGDHVIYDFKINQGFDEGRMHKPTNAVVDASQDLRK